MIKIKNYLSPEPIKWSNYPGWISLYLIFIQFFTGLLLLLYYRPTISEAYESVQQITEILSFGWLIRGIHIWAVHLLILFLLIHIIQKFITHSYFSASKITWVLGCGMLVLIGFWGATGQLLTWTQNSYWTTTFVTQIPTAFPFLGNFIKILTRGGNEITQFTLSRFYALHIFIIPLIFLFCWGFHVFSAKHTLLPQDLLSHVLALLILLAMLFSFTTFSPPCLLEKANPFKTLLNIKPAWYFLASYETFEFFQNIFFSGSQVGYFLGYLFQFGIYFLFLLIPFLAPSFLRNRKWTYSLAASGIILFFALTFLGYYR